MLTASKLKHGETYTLRFEAWEHIAEAEFAVTKTKLPVKKRTAKRTTKKAAERQS